MNGFPDQARVPARGRVDWNGPQFVPHSMAFPSAMAALRVFLGQPHRTHEIAAHNMTWRADDDYYFHLGISGEAWRFLFDAAEYFRFPELCGAAPVADCFAAEGIPVVLHSRNAASGAAHTDETEMKRLVVETLAGGHPALVLGRTANDWVLLATGYEQGGDTLVAWTFLPGGDHTNKSFSAEDCQYIEHWWEGADAVALVAGDPDPGADRKPVIRNALVRAAGFLRSAKAHPHGRFADFYDEWTATLRDAAFWQGSHGGRPRIDPEIWDLAERRAYAADFLRQAEECAGIAGLRPAGDAMHRIHDLMWRVHDLAGSPERPNLASGQTREDIVDVLKQCRALDQEAADIIEAALAKA